MTKEELTVQSPEDVRLQKFRSSLISSGGAMILFALWTVLRSIVEIESTLNYVGERESLNTMITLIVALGIADLILKFYVGMCARAEGLSRKKKKRPYLILGIIIACLSAVSLVYMIIEFPVFYRLYGVLGPIITLAVEATAFYVSLDLVLSAKRVRNLEQEIGRA